MRLNKSTLKVIDIINLFAEKKEPISLAEACRELSMPKTSVFELIHTLVEKGYMEIADPKLKTYKLGIKLFQIGSSVALKMNLMDAARPLINELKTTTAATVFLVVEFNGQVVYIHKAEGTLPVRSTCTIGTASLMHYTGVGKALLAAYSNERVKKITGGSNLLVKTQYTLRHYDDLIKELDKIRKRGYAIDNRESELDIFCIAAPVYDITNNPIAAISVSNLYIHMTPERIEEISKLVINTALTLSKQLGFSKEKLYFDHN